MKLYYYLEESKLCGPIKVEEMRWKGLTKETLVWTKGMDDWMYIGNIPEIAGTVPAHKPVVVETRPAGLKNIISQWITGTYRKMFARRPTFLIRRYLRDLESHSRAVVLKYFAGKLN